MDHITTPEPVEQRWQPSSITVMDDKPSTQHNTTITPETPTKPSRRLTGKQREFIRLMIENPATPLYAIAEQAGYNGHDMNTLSSIANENLQKPAILAELAKYDDTAQEVLTEVMIYSKELGKSGTAAGAAYASNARQSAQDILDRIHGKAKQVTETTNRSVTLSIDLTGVVSTTDLTGADNG